MKGCEQNAAASQKSNYKLFVHWFVRNGLDNLHLTTAPSKTEERNFMYFTENSPGIAI